MRSCGAEDGINTLLTLAVPTVVFYGDHLEHHNCPVTFSVRSFMCFN